MSKKIITEIPIPIWKSKSILGEGTLWVKEHNSIYFVDIKKKRIHVLNIKNKKKKIIKVDKLTHWIYISVDKKFLFFRPSRRIKNSKFDHK